MPSSISRYGVDLAASFLLFGDLGVGFLTGVLNILTGLAFFLTWGLF